MVKSLFRHNAAMEGVNTSVTPTEDLQLVLDRYYATVSKRVLILGTWSLIRTFLAFWVLNGSLFIFQGPYFHCFSFIHAKNVNLVCMYTTMVPV